ncbi:MAG TPA: hypothetical protein VHF23_10620, partial [Gaiellaceae bacterium]|nr:hypothetical protein [Gaiellaceae bacterium]
MGRVPSALLVAAVAVLAVAAAVDALRKGAEPAEPSRPQTRSAPAAAVSALRAAGVTGTLVYSDDDCRLHALRLPALRPAPASRIQRCEPHVPTGGIGAFGGDVVWAGLGVGAVQVVVSQDELTRSLRRSGYKAAGGFRAREAVPLVGGRHAVIAEGGSERLLVFLARTRAERVVEAFVGEADSLRPSPRGRYVALFEAGEPGMRIFSAEGRELRLPDVPGPRAIAWSPDERWTALATAASVFVFATGDPDGALVRIPVAARDVDWEADDLVAAAA